jgi:hypothetical protein
MDAKSTSRFLDTDIYPLSLMWVSPTLCYRMGGVLNEIEQNTPKIHIEMNLYCYLLFSTQSVARGTFLFGQ